MNDSPGNKLFYGYVIVLTAFIIQVAMLGPRASFGVFFKPMSGELEWTRALTAGAFSVSQLLQGISGVFMGGLNDRFGPRIVLTVCGLLLGAGMMLMATTHAAWQLYLFYSFIIGIGMGGLVAPAFSTVARWFIKRRSMMSGIIVAGGGGGMLVMPLLSDWLISFGWRNAFIILGAIIMVVTIVMAQFLKRDPASMGLVPLGAEKLKAQDVAVIEGHTFSKAVRTRQFWMLLVMMLMWGTGASTVMVHYVPFITDLGFSASTAAVIFSTLGGSIIAGSFIMGTVASRTGVRQASIISFFFLAAGLFSLLVVRELWMLYLLAFVFGMAFGGLTPSQSTLVADMFGMRSHGLLLGISSFSVLIGAAGGPFLAGYMFDQYGDYSRAFIILGTLAAAGLILDVLLKPPEKRKA